MDIFKLDSNESIFFKRSLEYVKTKTYDVIFEELLGTVMIPVSTEAPAGADVITYRSYSKIGLAKIISDYANDFPRVDVFGEEKQAFVKSIGVSYGYNIKEIRRAAMAKVNLEQKRAIAARRANDELVNKIAWFGLAKNKLQGLINYPGILEYTVPADGTGSSKKWADKTPDQIVRDITGMVSAIVTTTNGIERPDTLILPVDQYLTLTNTRMTDGNDKTILTYILENNKMIKRIEMISELTDAGGSGVDRMMAYKYDPNKLTLEIPQPFEQFAPQQKGMEFEIPCHSECGGVIIYYPYSVAYGDGI